VSRRVLLTAGCVAHQGRGLLGGVGPVVEQRRVNPAVEQRCVNPVVE